MKWFKQIKHYYHLIVMLLFSITIISGCGYEKETRAVLVSAPYSTNPMPNTLSTNLPEISTTPNPTITPTLVPAAEDNTLTLLAVGDNLIHEQVIESGKKSDGSYNYDHLFTHLKDEISDADISIINQETILGGSDFPYTGYPVFNSPIEIGDAIINAGFDVVLHATNHAMDKGFEGVNNTIHYWEKHKDITMIGLNSSDIQRDTIPVIERNGIKIALLNYTYGLNGYSLPKDKPYLVNMLDKSEIKKDISKAKQVSDFVIVFPHWGTEYVYEPDHNQKDWTSFFAQEGVDLVIGTHPHVVEPIEWIKSDNGHQMLVYYSLGNYVSYQREAPRMLGGMAKITLEKKDSKVYVTENGIVPIVTHYENHHNYEYGVYKLSEYTKEQALKHGVIELEENSIFTLDGTISLANEVLGDWIK
jgi:poly-gamma-glutamate capsule biosynthesis protein CapA/YwtB (metallophosphatase superfamily)